MPISERKSVIMMQASMDETLDLALSLIGSLDKVQNDRAVAALSLALGRACALSGVPFGDAVSVAQASWSTSQGNNDH